MEHNRNKTFGLRLSEKEAAKLNRCAKKCGLSSAEYIRQLINGYEPVSISTEYVCRLLEHISSLHELSTDTEVNKSIDTVLNEVRSVLLENNRRT